VHDVPAWVLSAPDCLPFRNPLKHIPVALELRHPWLRTVSEGQTASHLLNLLDGF